MNRYLFLRKSTLGDRCVLIVAAAGVYTVLVCELALRLSGT